VTAIVVAAVMAAIGTATVTATRGPTNPARAATERRKGIVRTPSVPRPRLPPPPPPPPRVAHPRVKPQRHVVSAVSGAVAADAGADAAVVAVAECAKA
jgi:hypothetical protein